MARASRWGGRRHCLDEAGDEVFLLVQAETTTAPANLAAICAADAMLARRYLALGAQFVAVGIDVTRLAQATRRLAEQFDLGVAPAPLAGAAY